MPTPFQTPAQKQARHRANTLRVVSALDEIGAELRRASHACDGGKIVTGGRKKADGSSGSFYMPCPVCDAEAHDNYIASDPMRADEAAYANAHGSGVRRSWSGN